jgi:hypothetical protein
MGGKLQQKATSPDTFAVRGLMQRKCACGQHTIGGSNCAACAKKEETLQRRAAHENESAHETRAVPESVHQVLSSAGQPLDHSTRSFMESRFTHDLSYTQGRAPLLKSAACDLRIGAANDRFEYEADHIAARIVRSSHTSATDEVAPRYDFSRVRVHTDEKAAESARAVNALAYTVGHHVVFGAGQYALGSTTGREILAHELTHVLQQQQGERAVMRAPTPDASKPRTYIVVYGSGQRNPETDQQNVRGMFRIVAGQKLKEIKQRLGKQVSNHEFVLEYTPTETDLKKVLNKKYDAPVAEVHIFSHGWEEGANLGGPVPPPNLKKRPKEKPEETQERRLLKEDLKNYDIDFADDAVVTFYGCNIGNVKQADPEPTLAQAFSDAFGVTVTASTKSTHFDYTGGPHQVPDTGGKMLDFTPTPSKARAEVTSHREMLQLFARLLLTRKALLESSLRQRGGPEAIELTDKLRSTIQTMEQLQATIQRKRALVYRLLRFLPPEERDALKADEKAVADDFQSGATIAADRPTKDLIEGINYLNFQLANLEPGADRTNKELEKRALETQLRTRRVLIDIHVVSTEDVTGADEVYVKVSSDNRLFRTDVKSLNDGQTGSFVIPLETLMPVDGPITIEVYDEDWPDADDLLVKMDWVSPFDLLHNEKSLDEADYRVAVRFDR